MAIERDITIPLKIRKTDAPLTINSVRTPARGRRVTLIEVHSPLAPAARLAPTFQAANTSAVKLI